MYDKQLVLDILQNISASLLHIRKRFGAITSTNDFIKDDIGLESWIASERHSSKLRKKQSAKYPNVEWKKAMGMRDIIVHHYFDIDHDHVCKDRLPDIEKTILSMIQDLENH